MVSKIKNWYTFIGHLPHLEFAGLKVSLSESVSEWWVKWSPRTLLYITVDFINTVHKHHHKNVTHCAMTLWWLLGDRNFSDPL